MLATRQLFTACPIHTSSSAVAERPRDAPCLSVLVVLIWSCQWRYSPVDDYSGPRGTDWLTSFQWRMQWCHNIHTCVAFVVKWTKYCLWEIFTNWSEKSLWVENCCCSNSKGSEVNLYSAFIVVPHTQGAQVRITQCFLQITPYLPLPRKHSPDGASPDWGCGHLIAACYSFIYPERMIADGLPT